MKTALTLYNTLTRRSEPFEPLEPGKVQMYYCGVTVYDRCHLGHARACIVWDVVRRYLQWRGYEVRFVQNFTDIDDKILNRAQQEGSSMEEIAERFIQAYFEDMERLNVQKASEYPRATHNLDGIKRLIHDLEHKGYAYPAAGDVYYAVLKFPEYGKLSGRKLEDMQAGASGRVDVEDPDDSKKREPFDFALWKAAKAGEPAWESAWGAGRPGWHIECSAMVRDRLGDTIDIHAGGADLIFPHHENEIAQSEAVTGKPLANYWLHNGMVTVNGEKMSKSLGNFITISELLDRPTSPMAVRLFVLTANYRQPIDFTDEAIAAAENGWNTIKEGLLFGYQYGAQLGWQEAAKRERESSSMPERGNEEEVSSILPSPTESQPSSSPAASLASNEWRSTLTRILLPFWKLPTYFGQFVKEHKELVLLTMLVAIALVPLKGWLEALKITHSIPLLPVVLKIIGIVGIVQYLLSPTVRFKLLKELLLLIEVVGNKAPEYDKRRLITAGTEEEQGDRDVGGRGQEEGSKLARSYVERFQTAVDNDLNFAEGLAVLFELAKELRREGNIIVHQGKTETPPQVLEQQWHTLVSLAQVLGLETQPESDSGDALDAGGLDESEIEALIQQRHSARKAKNFAQADRIRNDLQAKGITLIDNADGTTRWHRN